MNIFIFCMATVNIVYFPNQNLDMLEKVLEK